MTDIEQQPASGARMVQRLGHLRVRQIEQNGQCTGGTRRIQGLGHRGIPAERDLLEFERQAQRAAHDARAA
jgi:hypothetical protein